MVSRHPHVALAWSLSRRTLRFSSRLHSSAYRLTGALTAGQYVSDWRRFVRTELVQPVGTVAEYELRGSSVAIALRHRTADVGLITEIFHHRVYATTPAPAAVLARTGVKRIVDLGANIGLFGAWSRVHWPGATLLAFEPDPLNADVLRRCVAANGSEATWQVVEAAASNRDGSLGFVRAGDWSSRIEADANTSVPAVDVFPYLEDVDLLKIDIEGSEWDLLLDERFVEVPARLIALEYHAHRCPEPDARSAATAALERAGFMVEPVLHAPEGHGVLWGWRP
jgi:FkbM family methyltransferase